jgi:hypothetical protein
MKPTYSQHVSLEILVAQSYKTLHRHTRQFGRYSELFPYHVIDTRYIGGVSVVSQYKCV